MEVENEDVDIYLWEEGVQYDVKTFSEETINACFRHYQDDNPREARLTTPIGEVRWHVGSGLVITHFQIYESGYGSDVLSRFERFGSELGCGSIHIWIGTRDGQEKTKEFLTRNGFTNISEDHDRAHGLTYHAEKPI